MIQRMGPLGIPVIILSVNRRDCFPADGFEVQSDPVDHNGRYSIKMIRYCVPQKTRLNAHHSRPNKRPQTFINIKALQIDNSLDTH